MFIDERLTDRMLYGSGLSDSFANSKHEVLGGADFRQLKHPYVLFQNQMQTKNLEATIQSDIIAMFRRTCGQFNSFRVQHHYDYSTNNLADVPTYNDGKCEVGDGVYHVTAWYDDDSISTAPRRRVLKPNAGTVLVGIRDDFGNANVIVEVSTDPDPDVTRYTVDYTTGEITFTANSQNTITGITAAASAVITLGASHGRVVDDSIHISSVVGMTEINGLRGTITAVTATTVTVDIDSTLFTAYASGGVTNTYPQSTEDVTAGCYFDIPCVFDSSTLDVDLINYKILSASVGVIETYNP